MPERTPRPLTYAFFAYLLAATTGLVSVASTSIVFAENGWTPGLSLALGVITVVIVSATIIAQRQGRIREDVAALSAKTDALAIKLDGMASDSHSGVGQGIAYGQQLVAMLRHLTGLLDHLVTQGMADREVRRQVRQLAEQQETLAQMLADGGSRLTLDVANGEVYEFGKRVGREEALRERERGKDQTP